MNGYVDATDDIIKTFKTAWDANSAAIVGSVPYIIYPGVITPDVTPKNVYHGRLSLLTVSEALATLADGAVRRNRVNGLVTLQLFCPMKTASAFEKGQQLAQVARDAYKFKRSVSGGVKFIRTRIEELSPVDGEWRFNMVSEYEYDEFIDLAA